MEPFRNIFSFIFIVLVTLTLTVKSKKSEKASRNIGQDYINELIDKFSDIKFERIIKNGGIYVTNPINVDTNNDMRIFRETQIKRTMRNFPFVSQELKSKLMYFSQEEDVENNVYQFDDVEDLKDEKYSIQNIGHATQLIQLPDCNILTDPVFDDLSKILYPSKTNSHPNIEGLPKIDVILISHNHRDHVDIKSLEKLLKHQKNNKSSTPKLFVPLGDRTVFEKFKSNEIVEFDWYMKESIGPINFISIPADHRSGRNGYDHHKSLVIGWIINPLNVDVIIKYSGDTRSLIDGPMDNNNQKSLDEKQKSADKNKKTTNDNQKTADNNQKAVDAILWNEIKHKKRISETLSVQNNQDFIIPDVICLEPSGPNYTRDDMDKTHQSSSYSALLKFIDAKNLAHFSGKTIQEWLNKIKTIMIHHNKYELGPDRFNEGLFVVKKLLNYLNLNEDELAKELIKQKQKLEMNFDRKKLLEYKIFRNITSIPIILLLPKQTSLLVRAKDFIINEINQIIQKIEVMNRMEIREYVIKNTVFPKIGERLNSEKLKNLIFEAENVQKYRMLPKPNQ